MIEIRTCPTYDGVRNDRSVTVFSVGVAWDGTKCGLAIVMNDHILNITHEGHLEVESMGRRYRFLLPGDGGGIGWEVVDGLGAVVRRENSAASP